MIDTLKLFFWNKKYVFLFIGLFSILLSQRLLNYNGLASSLGSDGLGYYSYLPATVIYQDFDYTFFQAKENFIKSFYNPGFENYYGESLNKYYCGVSICLLPFFLLGILISAVAGTDINGYTDTFLMLVSLATIFYFLLSTYLISKISKFFSVPEWVSILVCLIFFFATNLYYYVIHEPSMSHTYCFFGVSLFFYAFARLMQKINLKNILLVAASLGLMVLIRPTNTVVILFLPFFFGSFNSFLLFIRSLFTSYLKPVLIAIVLLFAIVCIQFLFYYLQTGDFFVYAYQKESFTFSNPQLINILISYKGGLFLYTPLIFIVFLFILFSKGSRYKKSVFFVSFGIFTYIISSWWCWWYGGSFSNRAFIDIYPLFIIMSLYIYSKSTFRHKQLIFLISLPFIFANQVMAYQYKNGFMGSTDITKEKYWDIFLNPSLSDINEKIKKRITKTGTIIKKDSVNFENSIPEEKLVPEGYESKMACIVGEKNNYSGGIIIDLKNLDLNNSFYLYVECMGKQEKQNEDFGLAIAVEEDGGLKRWIFVLGKQFKTTKDEWKKITSLVKFERGEITAKSSMKAFAMAMHGRNLVDNLKYTIVK